jgi:undecaprenyl phosphate-alpha-L-ara4FN deformylase
MQVGLRIDVDTYRGTKLGVPCLCETLARHGIKATFFFCVGPDHMGRHLWRLVRPAFLRKMVRTRAASLYGWDILFRGTLGPGPVIGKRLRQVIRATADADHEIGLHAWDHYAWQTKVQKWTRTEIRRALQPGVDLLADILGRAPTCSAAPAWQCTEPVLLEKLAFPFAFNADCRGDRIFRPLVRGQELPQPQIPTTLPTYDEVVGHDGVDAANYNDFLLSRLKPGQLNVLTIHAEVEGIVCGELFDRFLKQARGLGVRFVTAGSLLKSHFGPLPCRSIVSQAIAGRAGWIACQADAAEG